MNHAGDGHDVAAGSPPKQGFGQSRPELESSTKRRVIFICTGNSARSQMAEALVNARLGATWQAWSAGTFPAGYVHPAAVRALHEIGIEHHGTSKGLGAFLDQPFDLVVTVCDDAAEECPVWFGKGKRVHLGFPDPARTRGSEDDVLSAFRHTRDDIERRILPLLVEESAGKSGATTTTNDETR